MPPSAPSRLLSSRAPKALLNPQHPLQGASGASTIRWGFITGIEPVPFSFPLSVSPPTLAEMEMWTRGGWGGGVRHFCHELELHGETGNVVLLYVGVRFFFV